MKTFIIRAQLHEAAPRDYKVFNTEMKKEAFVPIKENGQNDRLVYECHDRNSINDVINGVLHAGARAGKKISFTVMKSKAIGKQVV